MNEDEESSAVAMWTVLTYCSVIPDARVLGFWRTPRLGTSRAHTGQGYLAVGPVLGCMSPAIRRNRSWVRSGRRCSGFVV